eukprot:scaffold1465_cov93-Cylindrotheca_fusiformis.AAC.4
MVRALFNKKTKSQREKLTKELASNDFLSPNDPHFWHGRIFSNNDSLMIPPTVTWESPDQPRDDHINHDSGDWLTASEFTDTEEMMKIKIEKLAELLKNSKKTVVYSGAGISVSAGIGQAARGSQPNRKKHPIFGVKPTTCKPTITHFALGALASEHDLIHGWVQQNHDGLPQKAGFPQDRINEIHGSWYDPSNPVVVYSGSLRTHEFTWMEHEAETADLVLVLGTSLSGLNADQVPIKAAHRSLDTTTKHGGALGMVIINLQQTPHDGKASLRIFGSSDDVMRRLLLHHLHHLRIPTRLAPKTFSFPSKKEFLVPYNANGELNTTTSSSASSSSSSSSSRSSANKKSSTSTAGGGKMMIWNLEIGAK